MFWAITVLGISGLTITFLSLLALARMGLHGDELIAPFVFGLLMVFGIAGLLIWQLSRMVSLAQRQVRGAEPERPALSEHRPAQLAAPPVGPPSVVEHTTRGFAPAAYKGPGAQE